MKPIYILFVAASLYLTPGCKENSSNVEQEAKTDTRSNSQQVHPGAPAGGHDQTFLTDKLFHYTAAHVVGKKENPYENQWIDLDPDGTFKAGKLKEQTHTGRWDYNVDQKILLLRPDEKSLKMSEWKVMHNNDMVVWVGTQTYGNNSTQIQLTRAEELP